MNPEKVVFGFFIVMALTLNFGFVLGDLDNPHHHHVYEFIAAIIVNLIATVLKFGDRSQVGAVLLATSFVADLQLLAAAIIWGVAWTMTCDPTTVGCALQGAASLPAHVSVAGPEAIAANQASNCITHAMPSIVSLSSGALLANIVSVLLLVVETITLGR